jgi:hypothetical protein
MKGNSGKNTLIANGCIRMPPCRAPGARFEASNRKPGKEAFPTIEKNRKNKVRQDLIGVGQWPACEFSEIAIGRLILLNFRFIFAQDPKSVAHCPARRQYLAKSSRIQAAP